MQSKSPLSVLIHTQAANVESYYRNGDVITLSANNGTRLWMSNINTVKIQVVAGLSSYDLEVGRAGEVQVEDIKWVRDNAGLRSKK